MKHLFKFLLLLLALLLPATATAYDFYVDGIYYYINGSNATVTHYEPGEEYIHEYSGSVTIPTTVTYYGITFSVTSIGESAFDGCSGLTSVSIPNSVTSIGDHAFFYCSGLTSVTIPNSVTSLGFQAFGNCSGLTSVTIPNSVTSIGGYAFSYCSGLNDVYTFIDDPTTISVGDNVFNRYPSDYTERTLHVPVGSVSTYQASAEWSEYFGSIVEMEQVIEFADETVKQLCVANWDTNGDGELSTTEAAAVTYLGTVFKSNRRITSFEELQYFTGLNSISLDAFSGCTGLTSVTIPNSVKSIDEWAFSYCSGLTSIDIPNSVTTIGQHAFSACAGLTSVDIPNSVTEIGGSAFYGCTGLTSVTIPNSVTSIGQYAFSGCTGLTSVIVESGNPKYDSRNNCNAIIETATNTLIMGCKASVIPNSVTSLGVQAFGSCSGLTSVTIPNSVTSIGESAFSGCTGLTSVTIPNSVTTIGGSAFFGCTGLTNATIGNSVKSIGGSAFSGCTGLTSVDIPNSVTEIGGSAFSGCTGLTSVDIPNSVTEIGEYAFHSCSSLTSVTIGNSVTTIGKYAFHECSGLTSVTIPNSVTTIGAGAFNNCYGLTSINIPNSVTEIGDQAFSYCTALTSVTIPNSVTSIGGSAFLGCNSLNDVYSFIEDPKTVSIGYSVFYLSSSNYAGRSLHVPVGTMSAYQTNTKWSQYFGSIVEMEDTVIVTSIELNQAIVELTKGETLQLTATVLPEDATDKSVTWTSSNTSAAIVNSSGLVTAVAPGEATISATTNDGSNLSASCAVTVTEPQVNSDNYLSISDTTVFRGETIVIPIKMTNEETFMAFQTDIFLPEGFNILTDEDDEPVITPSSRLTSDHVIMADLLGAGGIRVICYTPRSKLISGNEGDLFCITVAVSEEAGGDYNIFLRNSLLTARDYSEYSSPDAAATIHVNTYIPGDVNDSRTVTVTDIVFTAHYILQHNPSPFIFEAADMNGDGNITVTDIMLIANLIMAPSMNAPMRMPALSGGSDRMSGEGVALGVGETRKVSILLDNEMLYTAFQLDLTLPKGLTASNFALTDRAGSHAFDVVAIGDNKVRALCYSPSIETIVGNSGALLTFDVTATATIDCEILVDGIELVTGNSRTVKLDSFAISVDSSSNVNELIGSKEVDHVDYFNVAGQQIDHPESGVTLIVTTYTDGTRTTTKVIK